MASRSRPPSALAARGGEALVVLEGEQLGGGCPRLAAPPTRGWPRRRGCSARGRGPRRACPERRASRAGGRPAASRACGGRGRRRGRPTPRGISTATAPEGLRVDLEHAAGDRRRAPGGRTVLPVSTASPPVNSPGPWVRSGVSSAAVEARDPDLALEHDVEAVHDAVLVEEVVALLEPHLPAVAERGTPTCSSVSAARSVGRRLVREPRIIARPPASTRRPSPPRRLAGPFIGSLTSKRVAPGSETTWMSPPWRPTTIR